MPTQLAPKLISWASILDPKTAEQAKVTATLPFIYPHIALMPDAHLGKGATVGSVIPTEKAIIPAAVGVDIGCGMIAVQTQWTEDEVRAAGSLTELRQRIEKAIPLSAGRYNHDLTATAQSRIAQLEQRAFELKVKPDNYAGHWRYQLGSLGSGNHFIEISRDENAQVWLFLHSGSRGVGNRIAQHHITVARRLMERYWISLPDPDLAYLVEETPEFWAYMNDLRWAQDFALANREEMMDRVIAAIENQMQAAISEQQRINCHHNFTQKERHYSKEVWVSRKGAISANNGEPGLIPGSMGTASYVVTGKGNPVSLNSSPHGAGRNYSRNEARRTFTMADLEKAMGDIEYRHTTAFIDEIPAAYKPIDQVMADSADLVEIKHTLSQIVNVKGD